MPRPRSAPPVLSRRAWLLGALSGWLLPRGLLAQNVGTGARDLVSPTRTLRFGVLPTGGTFDSRSDWAPLLTGMENYLGYPVTMFSVSTYAALARAVADETVDVAVLSGKLAVDAVQKHGMCVTARVRRGADADGYYAALVTRIQGPRSTLSALLADLDSWRLARGEPDSLTGFIIPQLDFFFAHGVDMETRFAGEFVGTHQEVMLAVANGEADLGATNTADLERFARRFPRESRLLHVIWASTRPATSFIVMRCSLGEPLRHAVQDFLILRGAGLPWTNVATQGAGREFSGFVPAGNDALLPTAQVMHEYARARALQSEWIDELARERALRRLDAAHVARLQRLQEP